MMREEIALADADIDRLEAELKLLLLPKDPNDGKDVIVEIRGAEGGEEANLFARDLFAMYQALRRPPRAGRWRCCRATRAPSAASTRSPSPSAATTRGATSSSRGGRTGCSGCR